MAFTKAAEAREQRPEDLHEVVKGDDESKDGDKETDCEFLHMSKSSESSNQKSKATTMAIPITEFGTLSSKVHKESVSGFEWIIDVEAEMRKTGNREVSVKMSLEPVVDIPPPLPKSSDSGLLAKSLLEPKLSDLGASIDEDVLLLAKLPLLDSLVSPERLGGESSEWGCVAVA